jgi:hypothetical protein
MRPREGIASSVDFEVETLAELHYWRKHPNLHGWMEQHYREKGDSAKSFNCVKHSACQRRSR